MPLRDVLTATWLQNRYLVGINLTDDDGVAYPDAIYTQSILNAISTLETELDLTLDGIRHFSEERHDRLDMDEEGFHFKRLKKRPLRGLTQLQWRYGNFNGVAVPSSWHETMSPMMGDVRVVPSQASLDSATVTSLSYFYNNWLHHMTPGWWVYSYLHGYDDRRDSVAIGTFSERFYLNGPMEIEPSVAPSSNTYTVTVSGKLLDLTTDGVNGVGAADTEVLTWVDSDGAYPQFTTKSWALITSVVFAEAGAQTPTFNIRGQYSWPQIFEDAVGLAASLLLLDTAGDLIVGAGIASKSISMDALSQSIATTSSATNSGYGARALAYGKRLKSIMDALNGQLDRREVFVV